MTPQDPPDAEGAGESRLDDPALIAEIEAEFAELTAELERIQAMPRSMAPKKAELVKSLREQWFAKQEARADRPEWRKKMDDALGEALTHILEDGIQETPDGRLEFGLRGDSVQTHGQPLISALLDGFQQMLVERFAKPRAPEPDATGKRPPPNPMQGLIVGLGQMLAQAIENTRAQAASRTAKAAADEAAGRAAGQDAAGASPEGAAASEVGGDGVEVSRREGEGKVEIEVKPTTDATFTSDVHEVNAAVGFDTRKGDAVPPILPQMFQSVVAGLGKMLNDATRTPTARPAAPPTSDEAARAARAPDAGAAEAATSARAEDAAETGAEGASRPDGPAPDEAAEAAPRAEGGRPVGVQADSAKPKPSVRVDFAGLLSQLFKVATPTVTPRKAGEGEAPAAPKGAADGAAGDKTKADPGTSDATPEDGAAGGDAPAEAGEDER